MNKEKAAQLLKKYIDGKATARESAILETWYLRYENTDLKTVTIKAKQQQLERIRETLVSRSNTAKAANKQSLSPVYLTIAAVLMLLATGTWLFYATRQKQASSPSVVADINPGGNKATLTLANGQKINLSDAGKGRIASASGLMINKTDDGTIVYKKSDNSKPQAGFNLIETPKGGQYEVDLPDGTKVWLNAASSLKYPASFDLAKERKVELTGEGYFEVAHNKNKPFLVKTGIQQVEVLGTHFNISAYHDDPGIRTTLLEGAVKVKTPVKEGELKPGQESYTGSRYLSIKNVDTDLAIAWKNGELAFRNEPLGNIMRKVSRWYNVEIIYLDPKLAERTFSGTVSRFDKVNKVFEILELTKDVHFIIDHRKIIVTE